MVMNAVLLLLGCLLAPTSAWLGCATVDCGSLGANVCAQIATDSSFTLRSSPCNEGYSCSFNDVLTWFAGNVTARPDTFSCTAQPMVSLGEYWPCANRQANKDLEVGTYPRNCLADQDCLYQDGTTGQCVCAPRSSSTSGYCKPDISSTYFEDYWTLCTQLGSMITDKYEGYYWYLRTQYAVYYDVSDLPACTSVLWEFVQMNDVLVEMAAGVKLALAVGGLFLVY